LVCFIIYLQTGDHNHEDNAALNTAEAVFDEVRTKIEDDPTLPIKRSFDQAMADYDIGSDDELPAFSRMRTRLQRVRSSVLPPLPQDIEDVTIEGEWKRTWRDKTHLSLLDNDWGVLIFATDQHIRMLQRCDVIYVDGTFKTCPEPYVQFVSVHGKYLGQVFTLASCLLSGKTIGHYRRMLQHLKEKVRQITGHRWRPDMAICDFEQALITAMETELRRTRIRACYFHFCQSLWRKIQDLGLADPYRRRRRMRKTLMQFMSIGHLPVAVLRQNFQTLARSRQTRRLGNRYPSLRDFIAYLDATYIQGTFPVAMWNVFDRESDCRTNNIVEGL
jgi:hypothetical protein